ncbi:unnamed protein product (macronuclear) [Paramecium tetraurelia]|uniref:EF-hand domain-containing protein n=1 Tax=Paramecium tetraurelia TaxID=5888 RepID=A0C141_PARTE|nr:uncharacterized protein GSPATT00033984001 [Paramecium tetraurelia]CAK64508.1 unnamed protein product [Paramecium tetraurelia]|eukprot:XP_001431906.1 hypothetical protein (macronuclear) [Paramecium tetraurelia strain d4-2]
MKYVQMADIFGAQLKQEIHSEEKLQKSFLGGVLSIIVTAVSLGYFIYVMDQWRNSNILPKSTNTIKAENYSSIQFSNENLVELCYWRYSNESIDPFRTTDNILMPVGIYIISGIPQEPFSLLSNTTTLSTYNSKLSYVEDLNIIQNSEFNPKLNQTKEFIIIITTCKQQLLLGNQTCAKQDVIDNFFAQQTNILSFWINFKYFNSKNQNFDVVKKQYYISFEKERAQQIQVILKQQKTLIDTGILFGNFNEQNFIFDAQFLMSTISIDFFQQLFYMESFLTFTIRLDPFSYEIQIVYPKLGEILAQVGSIVSIIMMVQYLASYYNEYLLQNVLVEAILKNLIQNYDSLKKSQDKKSKTTLTKLQKFAKQKLVFSNMINELSKIELFLLSLFDNTQVSKITQMKFLINNDPKQESIEGIFSIVSNNTKNIINEEEFQELFKAFIMYPLIEKKTLNVEVIE